MNRQPKEFDRLLSLIGEESFEKIQKKKILVVGLGGVGSYLVESLVRSGISNITIVDSDIVDITNMNRQLIALHSTIGKKKVDVVSSRINDINPNCQVKKKDIFLNRENQNQVLEKEYDYIIDCCDSMDTKKLLIDFSICSHIPMISSRGTANKMDPSKLEIVELKKTINDPVARILRKYVKDQNYHQKIMVLSSKELPKKNGTVLASNAFVPSIAGLLISSYVIRKIINDEK